MAISYDVFFSIRTIVKNLREWFNRKENTYILNPNEQIYGRLPIEKWFSEMIIVDVLSFKPSPASITTPDGDAYGYGYQISEQTIAIKAASKSEVSAAKLASELKEAIFAPDFWEAVYADGVYISVTNTETVARKETSPDGQVWYTIELIFPSVVMFRAQKETVFTTMGYYLYLNHD